MSTRNTTPKQSAGGGFLYETKVVALALAHMLARSSLFDPPGGVIELVEAQKPASHWHADDLLLTVRTRNAEHNLAFSIKSNRYITSKGFPSGFIKAVWKQLSQASSPLFDEDRDYLGLITAPVAPALKEAVFELLKWARQKAPEDLAVEIKLPGRANDLHAEAVRQRPMSWQTGRKAWLEPGGHRSSASTAHLEADRFRG